MGKTETSIERTRQALVAEGIVLCVRLGKGTPLLECCRAAVQGGLRILELTLTTPGALEVMKSFAGDPDVVAGGGTVLSREAVRDVAAAGGRFVLSPVFDPEVVDEAHRLGLLAVPGAATPAEILRAHRHGARIVKVFPAGALGGPAYLRAIRGPLPDVPLLPTSGPTSKNLAEYIDAGAVAVGVGGEVFYDGCTLEGITSAARRIRRTMDLVRGPRAGRS